MTNDLCASCDNAIGDFVSPNNDRANGLRFCEDCTNVAIDEAGDVEALEMLAAIARPRDDADWGSVRQNAAEDRFWKAMDMRGFAGEQFRVAGGREDWDLWSLKATTEELLDEAMIRVRLLAASR